MNVRLANAFEQVGQRDLVPLCAPAIARSSTPISILKIDLKDSVTHRFWPNGDEIARMFAEANILACFIEIDLLLSILAVARWGRSAWERPNAVCELQHQKAVVLARAPKRPIAGIQMNLRRAPIRSTSYIIARDSVVRARRG